MIRCAGCSNGICFIGMMGCIVRHSMAVYTVCNFFHGSTPERILEVYDIFSI